MTLTPRSASMTLKPPFVGVNTVTFCTTRRMGCWSCVLYRHWITREGANIVVCIEIRPRLEGPELEFRHGKIFFSSPDRPLQFWGTPSLTFNGCWGSVPGAKRSGCELSTQHHLASRLRTSLLCLNGVDRGKMYLQKSRRELCKTVDQHWSKCTS
jgi:hypothetical protein